MRLTLFKGLDTAGSPQADIQEGATHFLSVFAAFCVKKKAGKNLSRKTFGVLFEYADFEKARAKCTVAAKKKLGDYAIAHHPELVNDLALGELGRVLDNALGL